MDVETEEREFAAIEEIRKAIQRSGFRTSSVRGNDWCFDVRLPEGGTYRLELMSERKPPRGMR